MSDLRLAAEARLGLAFDPKTSDADLQVQADGGVLTVTYTPAQKVFAEAIPEVLTGLEGCHEIHCTMAETSILWIQEKFDPTAESFQQIGGLAQRLGAAIELMRLLPPESEVVQESPAPAQSVVQTDESPTGGVEDDDPAPTRDDGGLSETQEELVNLGRSGGQSTVHGGNDEIVMRSEGNGKFSLVVIGDIFLQKDPSAQKRMKREMALDLRDRLKAPIITTEELGSDFTASTRHAVKFLGHAALVLTAIVLVLSHQSVILDFLGGEIHARLSWLAAITVVVLVPVFAFLYGSVTQLALRLLRIE